MPTSLPPLWRNQNYLLLWTGQAISITGTTAAGVAFPLLVLVLTHSPFQAGLVGAMRTVPFLLLALPAGALVDRWNRKRVMIVSDVARALAFATIPLALAAGRLGMELIYLVVLVEGTAFSFFNLAEVSALPQVVPKEQIGQASAYNQAMWASGALVGPPIGGLLYGLSRAFPFLADAVSYALSVLSLLLIRTPFQTEREARDDSLRSQVREGISWLWHQPIIRFLGLIGTANGIAFGGIEIAAIVLARQTFHASPALIGVLFGAAAAGGVAGAVAGSWLQGRLTFAQRILTGLWGTALIFPFFALAPNLTVLAILGALIIFTGPIFDIAQFSYRISRIPDSLQGRVNSAYRLLLWIGQPAGQAGAGAVIQAFGPRAALGAMAGATLLIALAATLYRPLREAS